MYSGPTTGSTNIYSNHGLGSLGESRITHFLPIDGRVMTSFMTSLIHFLCHPWYTQQKRKQIVLNRINFFGNQALSCAPMLSAWKSDLNVEKILFSSGHKDPILTRFGG